MMREIKVRAWDEDKFIYFSSLDGKDDYEASRFWHDCAKFDLDPELSTGLKDKNGKEIYDSDIGIHEDGRFILIHYNDSMKLITATYLDDIESEKPAYVFAWQYIEIIGNIHENPELLEA